MALRRLVSMPTRIGVAQQVRGFALTPLGRENTAPNADRANDFKGPGRKVFEKYGLTGDMFLHSSPHGSTSLTPMDDLPAWKRKEMQSGIIGWKLSRFAWAVHKDGTLPVSNQSWKMKLGRKLLHGLYMVKDELYNYHRRIVPLGRDVDNQPLLAENSFVSSTATLSGSIALAHRVMLWDHVNIRANGTCTVVVDVWSYLADGVTVTTEIDEREEIPSDLPTNGNCYIGMCNIIYPGAYIRASYIGHYTYIGANAVIDNAWVEDGAVVAENTYVGPGQRIPKGEVWAGRPAQFLRKRNSLEKYGQDLWLKRFEDDMYDTYVNYEHDLGSQWAESDAMACSLDAQVKADIVAGSLPEHMIPTLEDGTNEETFSMKLRMRDFVPAADRPARPFYNHALGDL